MRFRFLFAFFIAFWVAAIGVPAQDASRVTVVMSALDNPRGLAFGPEGGLYVAEAGRGPSDVSCFTNPGQPQCVCATQNGLVACSGRSGAVSRLWHGLQERLVTGLPPWAVTLNGGRAEGPNDVALLGRGEAFITIGLEASPRLIGDMRNALGKDFGKLVQFSGSSGEWRFVADLAAYEEANPTRGPSQICPTCTSDSNPFGLLVEPEQRVVVDSGGNALLRVAANGEISTLAILPPIPQAHDGDPVPTRIALGPDGAYYVGTLTGAPFSDGAANIYRIVPGEPPEMAVVCTGFKAIIGIAFDSTGNLYVLQHSTGPTMLVGDGALFRIDSTSLGNGCTRANSVQVQTGVTRLIRPTAIAVGPDGALYVSNHGLGFGIGEVLRIEP